MQKRFILIAMLIFCALCIITGCDKKVIDPDETLPSPSLGGPTDGTSFATDPPTFQWNTVTDAVEYEVVVDDNSDFSSPVICICTGSVQYTPPTALGSGTYYWRVRAKNAAEEWSTWSGVCTFTITASSSAPAAPTLRTPADESSTDDTTPAFDWDTVSGAASFQIVVDNDNTFSSPEISQNTTSSSYTATSALSTSTFYWKVRAKNASDQWGSWSSVWSFTITGGTSPPAAPSLSSPANGSTTDDTTPAFDWGSVTGAAGYEILVDNSNTFSSPEISQNTTSSSYTATSALSTGTFYWKVRAKNASDQWGSWSSVWSFTITGGTSPPATPSLSSPANGSSTDDTTPTFDWGDVSGATRYELIVDNNADWSSPEIHNANITSSSYTPGTALSAGTYYWTVKAYNTAGSSDWAPIYTFTINAQSGNYAQMIIGSWWANWYGTDPWGRQTLNHYELIYDAQGKVSTLFLSYNPPNTIPWISLWYGGIYQITHDGSGNYRVHHDFNDWQLPDGATPYTSETINFKFDAQNRLQLCIPVASGSTTVWTWITFTRAA